MQAVLYGARVFAPMEVFESGTVVVSDEGRLAYVGPVGEAPRADGPRIDMRGRIVVPGFLDVHQHGGHGITFYVTPDSVAQLPENLAAYSRWAARNGVVGFLCSIAAPNAGELVRLVEAFVRAFEDGVPGAEALGLHLEGAFLSAQKKGAFDPAWLREPSLDELEALLEAGQGWIRQMSLAPELPGAEAIASRLREVGVVVAMGHTNADYVRANAALRANFTHITHTFNAQRGFHHREPGVVGAVMASDHVTAELIADAIHVHPGAMKALVRCLGTERVVLITDAMAGAGLPDGEYVLGGRKRIVREGKSLLPDGTIAGSTATMNQCVRNVHQQVGVPLREAVNMASLNPARAMGLADRLGSLSVGKDASLTVIDEQVNVYLTMVRGRIVYSGL
jgi:N-acetylglucosamine-6-phosphate deacetylase